MDGGPKPQSPIDTRPLRQNRTTRSGPEPVRYGYTYTFAVCAALISTSQRVTSHRKGTPQVIPGHEVV